MFSGTALWASAWCKENAASSSTRKSEKQCWFCLWHAHAWRPPWSVMCALLLVVFLCNEWWPSASRLGTQECEASRLDSWDVCTTRRECAGLSRCIQNQKKRGPPSSPCCVALSFPWCVCVRCKKVEMLACVVQSVFGRSCCLECEVPQVRTIWSRCLQAGCFPFTHDTFPSRTPLSLQAQSLSLQEASTKFGTLIHTELCASVCFHFAYHFKRIHTTHTPLHGPRHATRANWEGEKQRFQFDAFETKTFLFLSEPQNDTTLGPWGSKKCSSASKYPAFDVHETTSDDHASLKGKKLHE